MLSMTAYLFTSRWQVALYSAALLRTMLPDAVEIEVTGEED